MQVLTAVHGWPGVGKTTVAAALAHDKDVRQAFPDGVLWASLGTSPNVITELAKWARALGVGNLEQVARDSEDASAIVAGLLEDKRMLLLVDDAWDATHVQYFRVGGPGCATLVTTRKTDTALAIAPDENARYRLDVLTVEDAIVLLGRLARKVVAGHPEESKQLVNELGRLPLAIQVAGRLLGAQVVYGLGVTQLLKDIREGATLLEAEAPPDMADFVQETTPTVLALLMKSVDCLDDEAKARFPYLAPFVPKPASFDLAALAYIWGVKDPEPTVRALVDFGLIVPAETEGRFFTHAIITRVADHLTKDNEPWLKHAAYYAVLASEADDTYCEGGEGVLRGLEIFDAERENIESGRMWAAENALGNGLAAQLCVGYALRCPNLLSLRLHPREQIAWLESALQCARSLNNRPYQGAALGNLGLAYDLLGDYGRAIEFQEKALVIVCEIGDRQAEGSALCNMGNAYSSLGDYRIAIEFQERALEIVREIGDPGAEGRLLGNLGIAYQSLGNYRRAIEFHEKALEIAREIGDRSGEGQDLGSLGNACCSLGDDRHAIEYYEEALEIFREIGDRRGAGTVLGNLGNAYDLLGDYHRAIEFREKALEIAREIGDRRGEGSNLLNWGITLDKLGDRGRVIELARQALAIFDEIGSPGAEKARKTLAEWQAEGG